MTFLEDLHEGVDRLAQFAELDCETSRLAIGAGCLSDASVRDAFTAVASLSREVQKLEVVLAGVIAQRSSRAAGHAGLAQSGGFRTPAQMVQEITGVTRGEAIRVVKVGESLTEGAGDPGAGMPPAAGPADDAIALRPWHESLSSALLGGRATRAQVDVIRRGLGEPPVIDGRADDDVVEVWRVAAAQLLDEASKCSVEDLAAATRAVRDAIDPAGAEERWRHRFEARSFRLRTDADGRHHGHIVFDDATFAFWQSVMDAALRPRRGGPRFMTDDERAAAAELQQDPRTNDQLAYDLITDLVRVGATAEAEDVFGTRRAGVRLVTVRDDAPDGPARGDRDVFGRLRHVGHTEDGSVTLPGSMVERMTCDLGIVPVVVDACGNPLDAGRETRVFTPRQRVALAVRDGGCMWPGCDRPPSMTEAHHIDEWVADHGRTDIDRGILLCCFHHVHLHMTGMRIEREGKGPFMLLPPPGDSSPPAELNSKSPLRWIFDPPPRTGWRTRDTA